MTALPTASGIRETLKWLVSSSEPLTVPRLRDRYDLLSIPALSGEPDPWRRAEMFVPVLRLAITELPSELKTLAKHLFLHSAAAGVTARRGLAMDEMPDGWPLEDREPPTSKRRLDPYEARLLHSLAETLVGDPLTLRTQAELGYPAPAASALSTPVGYQTIAQQVRLRVDLGREPRYTYYVCVKIVALRRHVFLYVAKTDWTGGGTPPVKVRVLSDESGNHTELGSRPDSRAPGEPVWSHWVHLGRELPIGVPEVVRYRWTALDRNRTSKPYLAVRPVSAMFETLALYVRLPELVGPVMTRQQRFIEGEWKDVEEPVPAAADGKTHFASWTQLRAGQRYALWWPRLY